MQPFPHLNKIWSRLANWLQRYSSSKVWNFCHSSAGNSEMSGLIQPKIELDQAFKPVLVISNFDDDSIKNELELVFIKHYAPNSLHLTVNSHHVLFVKMLAKFSKGNNSSKNISKFDQVIYSSSPISWPSFKPLAQIVSEISYWQV